MRNLKSECERESEKAKERRYIRQLLLLLPTRYYYCHYCMTAELAGCITDVRFRA